MIIMKINDATFTINIIMDEYTITVQAIPTERIGYYDRWSYDGEMVELTMIELSYDYLPDNNTIFKDFLKKVDDENHGYLQKYKD